MPVLVTVPRMGVMQGRARSDKPHNGKAASTDLNGSLFGDGGGVRSPEITNRKATKIAFGKSVWGVDHGTT